MEFLQLVRLLLLVLLVLKYFVKININQKLTLKRPEKSRISTLDLILPPKYKLKIFSTICVIPNLDSKFPIFIFISSSEILVLLNLTDSLVGQDIRWLDFQPIKNELNFASVRLKNADKYDMDLIRDETN